MRRMFCVALAFCGMAGALAGCQHPSVSAVSLNAHHCDHHFAFLYDPCKEPEGIPFYLPKPLLIVAKNFRNVEEAKVGLTDPVTIPGYFDDQAKYADLNARTNFAGVDGSVAAAATPGTAGTPSPGSVFPDKTTFGPQSQTHVYADKPANVSPAELPSDGLTPDTFYTYQIIFVPDLTQKYGLKVKGGAGEFRAAMNLVNGWQFTGLGPYYMKDSSTAQNTLAAGITANLAANGVGDVIKDIASLKPGSVNTSGTPTAAGHGRAFDSTEVAASIESLKSLNLQPVRLMEFAEITVYEAFVSPEGTMEWKPIHDRQYNRDILGALHTTFKPGATFANPLPGADIKGAASGKPMDVEHAKPLTSLTPGRNPTMLGASPPSGLSRGAVGLRDKEILRTGALPPLPPAEMATGAVQQGGPEAPFRSGDPTPGGNPATGQPGVRTTVRQEIGNDPLSKAFLTKKLGLLPVAEAPALPTIPVTGVPASPTAPAPLQSPIMINQYAAPSQAAPRMPIAKAAQPGGRFHLLHKQKKQRPKIQIRSIDASGVGEPGTP